MISSPSRATGEWASVRCPCAWVRNAPAKWPVWPWPCRSWWWPRLLLAWGQPYHAAAVGALLAVQLLLMRRLLVNPRERAPWYNGTGVSLYVLGMLVSAFALKGLAQ